MTFAFVVSILLAGMAPTVHTATAYKSASSHLQNSSKGDSLKSDSSKTTNLDVSSILVLGDSISAGYGMNLDDGWVNLMNQTIRQRELAYRMVNASISGETTVGGLKRLPDLLQEHAPSIVVIELGGNDGMRGYPTTKIMDNLLTMTDLVKAAGAQPVIITMRIPPNYGPRYTRAFEQVFADAAEQSKATLVPFLFEELAVDAQMMQDDGIHPTAKAQPLLVEGFLPYLLDLM
ncbi:arylesterase [Gammaproteobacteria bacterium]|nr:arylesterase [Gammaproteobacteria bacterium]